MHVVLRRAEPKPVASWSLASLGSYSRVRRNYSGKVPLQDHTGHTGHLRKLLKPRLNLTPKPIESYYKIKETEPATRKSYISRDSKIMNSLYDPLRKLVPESWKGDPAAERLNPETLAVQRVPNFGFRA